MGSLSLWHWLVVLAVVVVLFGGRGRLSGLMHDIAKGLKAFKSGIEDEKHSKAHTQTKEKIKPATPTSTKKKTQTGK